MRDRVRAAIYAAGFGPLCELPPGGPGGGTQPPTPTPPAGQPPTTGGAPAPGSPPAAPEDRSGWIPRERFDEVNAERDRLKKADEARQTAEAEKKGEFEKLRDQEKSQREAAEAKALRIGRRGAFIARAAGKVVDADAAYTLAMAAGLLDEIEIDEDGNAVKPAKVDAAVEEIVKRNEFLKPTGTSRGFGEPHGGQPPAPGRDPSTMSAQEQIRSGFSGDPSRRRRE